MARRETSKAIADQAARWVARIDRGPLSAVDQAALDAWLSVDSRRLGALARAQAAFARMDRAEALPIVPAAATRRLSRRQAIGGGACLIAASVAAVVGIGWLNGGHAITTTRGDIRIAALPDGSRVTLDTTTRIVTRFDQRQRNVELTAGRALFDVAKDPAHPFIVRAGDVEVTAVGTSFSVAMLPNDHARVLVREGVVRIRSLASATSGAAPPVLARANMTVDAAPAATRPIAPPILLSPDQVSRQLAWREGMLVFEATPLAEAAREFDAYNNVRIEVADAALGRRTITGRFSATDPRGFARAAAISLDAHASNSDESVTLHP